jgi:PTH1 family peptidyl-tRNA hydrolase
MRLIVGLGNPGAQYEHTRHNVGFRVMDMLAAHYGWQWERRKRAMLANGTIGSEKVVLVKPLTYMNNSGEAVGELVHWYKVQPEDLLVIYDELDLPIGKVRLRAKGSAGGHNGLDSIIRHVHTNQFPRLRVGIGRPDNHRMETINYVLGIPPTDERLVLEIGEKRAAEAVPLIIQQGLEAAMNSINLDPEEQKKLEEKQRQKQIRRQLALSGGIDTLDSQQDRDGQEKPHDPE